MVGLACDRRVFEDTRRDYLNRFHRPLFNGSHGFNRLEVMPEHRLYEFIKQQGQRLARSDLLSHTNGSGGVDHPC